MKKIFKKIVVALMIFAVTFSAIAPAMTVEAHAESRDYIEWKLMKVKKEYNNVLAGTRKAKELQQYYVVEMQKTSRALAQAKARGLKVVINYLTKRMETIKLRQDKIIQRLIQLRDRKIKLEKLIDEYEKLLK